MVASLQIRNKNASWPEDPDALSQVIIMREMGWSWEQLMTTPVHIVQIANALIQGQSDGMNKSKHE